MKEPHIIICAILAVLFLCVASFCAGINSGINITKQQAVGAGAAKWSAGPNGEPMFVWKESK